MFSAQVFEGHPFIVEAGVSVGGRDVKQVGHIFVLLSYVYSFAAKLAMQTHSYNE